MENSVVQRISERFKILCERNKTIKKKCENKQTGDLGNVFLRLSIAWNKNKTKQQKLGFIKLEAYTYIDTHTHTKR